MELKHLVQRLKDNNCRITDQRMLFLETLANNQTNLMTVEEITEICQRTNKAVNTTTIYRNIELLDSMNLLYALNIDRHTVAYKLLCHDHHHHHIICSNCGEMLPIDYCPLNPELMSLLKEKGYKLKSHTLDLYGICTKCQGILDE